MGRLHLHLQALGGIAGDMFVAAMLDAFPQYRDQVFADIGAVIPGEIGAARLSRVLKNGIAASHFSLDEQLADAEAGSAAQAVDETRTAYRRVEGQAGAFSPRARRFPSHRHAAVSDYAGIRKLIAVAKLSGTSASHALSILAIIAEAEAQIHGIAIEKVHFHELAAWDSLTDVVAAGSIISALGEASWSMDALPLGSGLVKTQHGLLPVPAPATMRILEGYPWRSDDVPGERVTPTGAAIVRYLVPPEQLSRRPQGVLVTGGYGAGTKEFAQLANILRVMVFDESARAPENKAKVAVIAVDGVARRQSKVSVEGCL